MKANDCNLGWINTLSNRVFKTYEEAYNDAKTDLLYKCNIDNPSVDSISKCLHIVYLWLS